MPRVRVRAMRASDREYLTCNFKNLSGLVRKASRSLQMYYLVVAMRWLLLL